MSEKIISNTILIIVKNVIYIIMDSFYYIVSISSFLRSIKKYLCEEVAA
jgi:hypothetical protein